jgi:biopolymer transport protein ExbB/TolQ
MITILFICMICLLTSCTNTRTTSTEGMRHDFAMLKQALDNKEEYAEHFQAKLSELKQKERLSSATAEKYFYNKLIYDNYILNNTDSALAYIEKNYQIALNSHNQQWLAENYIAKGYAYSAAGLLIEAKQALEQASRFPMDKELKINYYSQQIYYYIHESNYNRTGMTNKVSLYGDSIISLDSNPDSPYYLWGRFFKMDRGKTENEVIKLLDNKIKTMSIEDPWYARLCWAEGFIYYSRGDKENQTKYFCLSLVSSIKQVNRDVMQLPIVASTAADVGELGYANRFMQAAIAIQNDFPDRARASFMPQQVTAINNAIISQLENGTKQRQLFLYILSALIILLLGLLIQIYLMFRKQRQLLTKLKNSNEGLREQTQALRQMQTEMETVNAQLQKERQQLENANEHLLESDYLKEKYIGDLFTTCSDYLVKMEQFQKTINRKLKAKQYEDLLKITEPLNADASGNIKEFQETFDKIFLSIFPDFVDEFNELLRPEERIKIDKGTLNNELRIYALVRLGINNSIKIATILHISSQTVYNSRMKMRSKATPSTKKLSQRVSEIEGHLNIAKDLSEEE